MSLHKKEIMFGKTKYLVIDLTEPLSENTEFYPGDPNLSKEIFSDIYKTGCQNHIYKLSDHHFHPHGDAPNHQNLDMQDKGFEIFDLNYAFNDALLIDLSEEKEAEEIENIKYLKEIKKQHLLCYSYLLSKKGAVLIRTGYDKWIEKNNKHTPKKIPYLNKDAADFLSSFKNLKVIGTDSLTIDSYESRYAHQKFKNKFIVESLVHLYEIPEYKKDNFILQTSAIRIVGATGGPVVAYAFIEL